MLVLLSTLTIPVSTLALLNARREYRQHGKLTIFGLGLVCGMLFVPNLVLHYATSYPALQTPLEFAGVAIAAIGAGLCLSGMITFRSIKKILCIDPEKLTSSGPYRWSRNPQYLGWLLFLVGFSVMYWSPWNLVSLTATGISLHLLVLVEEEHLERSFGVSYLEYKERIPRYFGWQS